MDTREIEAGLLEFVRREIFADDADITAESDLIAAGFDSMSLVRVLLHVETTYGLWIPANEITGETLRNLNSLAAAVGRLLHDK